jgi:mycothiol synthase
METNLLAGVLLRPFAGEADLAAIARIYNAENEADGVTERYSLERVTADFAHPSDSFDARRDVTIAEVEGRPVAIGSREWVDTTDGLREYRLHGAVEPAFRRRGIGSALLREGERQIRELAAQHRTPNSRVFGSWSGESQPANMALLASAGFTTVRWFFEMTRPNLDDIPEVALPAGLTIRPITEDMAKQVWDADVEAFRDHWGGFDQSDEHLARWLADPTTDLALWIIAFDGDEIAGGIINAIDPQENEALGLQRGWLASVFTRRQWRKQGLATALISRSLGALREKGLTSAALGVDADNPSGALGVYERQGFEVSYRSTAWRKPFQP